MYNLVILAIALLLNAAAAAAQPSGPDGNIPLPPDVLLRRLQDEPFEIAEVKGTKGGVMTTDKVTLVFPKDGMRIKAKWKAAPQGGEGWNNYPRREIGAYAVQRLFLDPDDYVVPPVAARCIPLDMYTPLGAHAKPNLPHAQCVYGTLSAWIENVREPEEIFDEERFKRDPRYARLFGNLNLLTYLIAHRDRKQANFLISTDALNPQTFSIDNGIAFGGELYNFFTWHFDNVIVRSLPADAVARLRHVTPAQLDALGAMVELQPDAKGVLHAVPPSPVTDPQVGERMVGGGIQLGLTTDEIAAVRDRIQELLAAVDSGKLTVF